MNPIRIFAVTVVLNMALATIPAQAGSETGNGGGAWVCREQNGEIRWVKFVDLFEAESEFGLELNSFQNSSLGEVIQTIRLRLADASPQVARALDPYLILVNNLQPKTGSIHHTLDHLEIINDSLYRLRPSSNQCPGGALATDFSTGLNVIPYEQVVNFKNDGSILIQQELFAKLSTVEQAALVFHEAIYAYRREIKGDANSVTTRRWVGLLFSAIKTEELGAQIFDTKPGIIPTSREELPGDETPYQRLLQMFDQAKAPLDMQSIPIWGDPRRVLTCLSVSKDLPDTLSPVFFGRIAIGTDGGPLFSGYRAKVAPPIPYAQGIGLTPVSDIQQKLPGFGTITPGELFAITSNQILGSGSIEVSVNAKRCRSDNESSGRYYSPSCRPGDTEEGNWMEKLEARSGDRGMIYFVGSNSTQGRDYHYASSYAGYCY